MRHRGAALELADLQGGLFEPYRADAAVYLLLGVEDAPRARRWLAERLPEVTTAAQDGAGAPWTLNLAFTFAGLAALGVPAEVLAGFPEDFRQGMAARAAHLGDTGTSAPDRWEAGLGTGEAHVLCATTADSGEVLAQRVADLRGGAEAAGLRVVHEQHAAVLPGRRGHFGFAEGLGDVAVEGTGRAATPGHGMPTRGGRGWRPVKAGEFVLGYIDEDAVLPDAPPGPLGRNATYVVLRKLHMDVPRFTRFIRDAGAQHGVDPEWVAAKIVGRWRDGTPLVLSPDRPDPALVADGERANDFLYATADPDGLRCPLGAHIRRVNPRDALGYQGQLSKRHRIIRRGMPYGPPAADPLADDGEDRGLVFICFNASLERQFETIQALWVDDGNTFGLGEDKDFLIGNPDGPTPGKMTLQGDPPRFLGPQPAFVTTRGGEYLFEPGLRGLRALADGRTEATAPARGARAPAASPAPTRGRRRS